MGVGLLLKILAMPDKRPIGRETMLYDWIYGGVPVVVITFTPSTGVVTMYLSLRIIRSGTALESEKYTRISDFHAQRLERGEPFLRTRKICKL